MKKLLLSSMLLISILSISAGVTAQELAFHSGRSGKLNPYPDASSKIVDETEVTISAVRDFKKSYSKAVDIKWQLHDNGASVYFTNNGLKMRSTYNGKGKKLYTLKYYNDESALPSDMRRYIRSNYYDYKIPVVTEVTANNHSYYLVKVENQKEVLTLRIINDEVEVAERITRRK